MYLTMCALDADGATAMENLWVELARAKEQARKSDAAASKAAEELEAEKVAHCRSRKEMAGMAVKLKDATDRYEVFKRERRAEQEDLKKANAEAKDARSAMRAMKEELRQAGDIAAGKPFLLRRKFTIRSMLSWANCGVRRILIWIWRRVRRTQLCISEVRRIMKWKSFSSLNSIVRSVHFR